MSDTHDLCEDHDPYDCPDNCHDSARDGCTCEWSTSPPTHSAYGWEPGDTHRQDDTRCVYHGTYNPNDY